MSLLWTFRFRHHHYSFSLVFLNKYSNQYDLFQRYKLPVPLSENIWFLLFVYFGFFLIGRLIDFCVIDEICTKRASNMKIRISYNRVFKQNDTILVDTCQPGTFSNTGLVPCSSCLRGKFQPETGAIACLPCPDLMFTLSTGSASQSVCTCT